MTTHFHHRLSPRHDWGSGVPTISDADMHRLIIWQIINHKKWENRDKYPKAQIGIIEREFIPYDGYKGLSEHLKSDAKMGLIINIEDAISFCDKEFDDFLQTRQNIRASVIKDVHLHDKKNPLVAASCPTHQQDVLLNEKFQGIVACMKKGGML